MRAAALVALLSALLIGAGTTFSRFGLRYVPPRVGASISVPASAVMFWALSPLMLHTTGYSLHALVIFTLTGLFFPAIGTILNFEAARKLGPTISSSVGTMAAVFALATAIIFLNESLTTAAVIGTSITICGVILMSWQGKGTERSWMPWMLIFPLGAAALRGSAQTSVKFGLGLWANPFAATLTAYTLSAVVLLIAGRPAVRLHGRIDPKGFIWFVVVGLCNGLGLLAIYAALDMGKVSLVSPIVTSAPVFTLLLSWWLLPEEKVGPRTFAGVVATVVGVVLIVGSH